jgi:hypothetical protein
MLHHLWWCQLHRQTDRPARARPGASQAGQWWQADRQADRPGPASRHPAASAAGQWWQTDRQTRTGVTAPSCIVGRPIVAGRQTDRQTDRPGPASRHPAASAAGQWWQTDRQTDAPSAPAPGTARRPTAAPAAGRPAHEAFCLSVWAAHPHRRPSACAASSSRGPWPPTAPHKTPDPENPPPSSRSKGLGTSRVSRVSWLLSCRVSGVPSCCWLRGRFCLGGGGALGFLGIRQYRWLLPRPTPPAGAPPSQEHGSYAWPH